MNPVTTALTLNMQLPNIAAVSWAVQGDQLSRQIQATLVDGSTAWNPQAGYHGIVRFHKPDGTSGVYDVDEDGNPAVTWTGNVATVKIVQQALTVAGTVLMQLEFYDANEARVTAFGWANNVQPSAVTDNEFLSSDYYNILTLEIAGVLGAAGHSPYIDSVTNHWMIWDSDINDYVDSGVYATGPAPTLQSTAYEYTNDASGTTPPASGWSGTRPAPVQGQFSWTKTTLTFDSGTTVYYTVAYQGIDGAGADFVKALIAQAEASTTAANAYAVGDYFILANVLYVATAAIQIGDTITPGTNCTQTTVAAELVGIKNTLNSLSGDVNTIRTEINRNLISNGTNLNNVIPTSSNSNVYAYGNDLGSMVNAPRGFSANPFAIDAVYNSYYIYQTLYAYPNASQKKPLIFQRAKYYLSGESIWSNWYNASPPVVQSGIESVTGNASSWVYKTITFPVPYYNTPMVTVSMYSVSYATDWTTPMIDNVTKTGFRFGWYKASGTKEVLWQAFGT